jgi:threonylcarbamoyladenosine tRNA methylthiotransferase MtaB
MDNKKSNDTRSKPEVITFGCRLNTYESAIIEQHLAAHHHENTVVFNTCAVTKDAERTARYSIRKFRRENPNHQIIVTGCSAQMNPDTYKDMPEVDLVLGNHEKMQEKSYQPSSEAVQVGDIMQVTQTTPQLVSKFDTRARAIVEIQNGCDHRCTFCTIPLARGNNRSRPVHEILEQIDQLVAQGHQEIIFTGVDITNYGADLPGQPTLGQLCKRVLSHQKTLSRLRISSIDAVEVDDDFFHVIKNEPRLMPHLHVSLQAGANLILKRMKRRHLREDAIAFCQKIRALRPDITFGADIIAGFPTETDEHFQDSLNLVDDCGLTHLHVFPYSPRPETPAARMPQVAPAVIKKRAQLLREKGQQALFKYHQALIGKTIQVLIEKNNKGHSPNFDIVEILSDNPLPNGTIVSAKITDVKGRILSAIEIKS